MSSRGNSVNVSAALPTARARSGVTVLIPAYNEAASVGDTIDSLENQTVAPTEIIVIDDCSTDALDSSTSS